MVSLGAMSFFTPWAFAGFLILPVVWWIVRLTPPRPQRIRFPPIRLLAQVTPGHQSSQSYPWWLLALRLLMVALFITGAATPIYSPRSSIVASGPLVIVVDDGWAAATGWQARIGYMEDLITQADRQGRGVVVVNTATPLTPVTPGVQSPAEARSAIQAMRPKPWQTDRAQIPAALSDPALALTKAGRIVWLSDGLLAENDKSDFAAVLERMGRLGPVILVGPEPGREANALFPPYGDGEALVIPVRRAHGGEAVAMNVVAFDASNRAIGRAVATFDAGAVSAEARLVLPVETRNRIEQLRLEGEQSAGAVVLLDERWRRRPVGLVSADGIGDDQPLLSGQYYLDRALQTVTDVRSGPIDSLLDRETAVMILTDPAPLNPADHEDLVHWTNQGGVLVIFAGPRLAALDTGSESAGDTRLADLLPVSLRSGGRAIGGAMSWRRPAAIAPFPPDSPFQSLIVPNDVRIQRQVLAEPTPDLDEKTWARLTDGTPLVTARPRGEGMVVLFHVTANAEWSNLPLSGLFVDMLQRVMQISHGVGGGVNGDGRGRGGDLMSPQRTLDGLGKLGAPPVSVAPLGRENFDLTAPSPRHPPGFYGPANAQRALNLTSHLNPLQAIGALPENITREVYSRSKERSLAHWLFVAAALLLGLDMVLSLWLRGVAVFPASSGRTVAAGLIAASIAGAVSGVASGPAHAQELPGDAKRIDAANQTRIAYVVTGDTRTDNISRLGLTGLGAVLAQRTAVELAPPDGIDPAADELAFYPLIYWPVTDTTPVPSALGVDRINTFLANGGTILFDTIAPGGTGDMRQLRQFAAVLDIPRLTAVPGDHVLTRAFYLLSDFPGRWAGSPVWIVPAEERVNDGVSPVVAGGHHWAAAWAVDGSGQPLFAAVPGGERQREYAYRFGVNLVMYVLTGNYKGDQVHLPTIMNRLGQ